MLKYIFSFVFLCSYGIGFSQVLKDTIKEKYGIRFGIDLHRIARSFYEKDYRGIEFVADYRISQKFYIAAELGNENKTIDDDRFNFTTNGSYFKVGFDYNSHQNWLNLQNMIYVGMRYSVSSFNHKLNTFSIYDPVNYYGLTTLPSGQQFDGLNASWIEFLGGLKAEVFSNVYVGFTARLHYLVSDKKPTNFDNLYIPGFNRTYDGKFGTSFNYTLSYLIPIYKKAKQ